MLTIASSLGGIMCSVKFVSFVFVEYGFLTGVNPRLSPHARQTGVPRNAEGFGESAGGTVMSAKKGIKTVREEDLKALHGDKWEVVDKIFKGEKAQTPDAIMRARFTALVFKDPVFLAATERDADVPREQRAKDWAVTLGLQKPSFLERIALWGENDKIDALKEVERFEVVDTKGNEVEFKIFCAGSQVLHERSTFREDKRFGFVYTGESSFVNWS